MLDVGEAVILEEEDPKSGQEKTMSTTSIPFHADSAVVCTCVGSFVGCHNE